MGDLSGRAAVVTGASQGLGLEIARAFVREGASVLLCARDGTSLEQARARLACLARPNQIVAARAADVSVLGQVTELVESAFRAFPRLHILVNNAGVYGPIGSIEDVQWDEWIRAVEINLMGSVLMCRAVLPHFRAHSHGKIIQLSGGGATNPLPRITAYAASKAAVVRFAESLALDVSENHIDVNCIAPGPLNTRLLDEVLAAGPAKAGRQFYERSLQQKETGGSPLQRAAELAVFLASSRSDGITGRLFSAIWDPWESMADHLEELRKTDIYTLRRIVPGDRGLQWGER
jgi:3-oxoacyl-[acyl-carrier protein] reductase